MEKNIFIYQQLINPSFFQRLFRQYPEENVVIEINNTLATQPILDISVEDLKLITDQIPIDVYSVYQLNFIEFYAVYLNNCVKNYKITDLQFSELLHLQNIFNLDPSITKKIHTEIVGKLPGRASRSRQPLLPPTTSSPSVYPSMLTCSRSCQSPRGCL